MSVRPERLTAELEPGFVVFLIGMRVNRWWKIHRWLPVILAMGRMQRELQGRPELGLLGMDQWLGRTTMMVSYWRSYEHLHQFATRRDLPHAPAWGAFMRAVGTNGDIGIWHETYTIAAGSFESVYVNMPPFGLGAAGTLVPATGALATSRGRLAASAARAGTAA